MTGRLATRAALARLLPDAVRDVPFALVELFGKELDQYAEIIVAPGAAAGPTMGGFMTRGEGPGFSERVRIALAELDLGVARDHHAALATWFEHLRAFFKLEWHVVGDTLAPLAACYFRRRPSIDLACERLAALGAGPSALARVREVADALEKTSIHFVSAAFRPGHAPSHKLYFSQLADAEARPRVRARIERVFELFGIAGEARDVWRAHHDDTVGFGEPTCFVSMSFVGDALAPSFKIDYADVSPARAAAWRLRQPDAATVEPDARLACALANTRALSFLGVRFARDAAAPTLKYYADIAP